jgi:hypothetical protein
MLLDELTHLTLSILAGGYIAIIYGNGWAILLAILAGVFVDIDHLFDYLLYKRFRNLNLHEFFPCEFFNDWAKVILPFHGFEYAIILIILAFLYPSSQWWLFAISGSLLMHLIYDTISNKPYWPTYFILYRAAKRFRHGEFDFKSKEQ